MFLLQSFATILFLSIGAIAGLAIIYLVIKNAVCAGLEELLKETKYQSRLLSELSKINGVEEEVIRIHKEQTVNR
jgi:hypothetical protein